MDTKMNHVDSPITPTAVLEELLMHDLTEIRDRFPVVYKKNHSQTKDCKIYAALRRFEDANLWCNIAKHLNFSLILDRRWSAYSAFCAKIKPLWRQFLHNPLVPSFYKQGKTNLVAIFRAAMTRKCAPRQDIPYKLRLFDEWVDLLLPEEPRVDFRALRNAAWLVEKFTLDALKRMPQFIRHIPQVQRAEVIDLLAPFLQGPNEQELFYQIFGHLLLFAENQRRDLLQFSLSLMSLREEAFLLNLSKSLQKFHCQGWTKEELELLLTSAAKLILTIRQYQLADKTLKKTLAGNCADPLTQQQVSFLLLYAEFSQTPRAKKAIALFIQKVGDYLPWEAIVAEFRKFSPSFIRRGKVHQLCILIPSYSKERLKEWETFLTVAQQWPEKKSARLTYLATLSLAAPLTKELDYASCIKILVQLFATPVASRAAIIHRLEPSLMPASSLEGERRILLLQLINTVLQPCLHENLIFLTPLLQINDLEFLRAVVEALAHQKSVNISSLLVIHACIVKNNLSEKIDNLADIFAGIILLLNEGREEALLGLYSFLPGLACAKQFFNLCSIVALVSQEEAASLAMKEQILLLVKSEEQESGEEIVEAVKLIPTKWRAKVILRTAEPFCAISSVWKRSLALQLIGLIPFEQHNDQLPAHLASLFSRCTGHKNTQELFLLLRPLFTDQGNELQGVVSIPCLPRLLEKCTLEGQGFLLETLSSLSSSKKRSELVDLMHAINQQLKGILFPSYSLKQIFKLYQREGAILQTAVYKLSLPPERILDLLSNEFELLINGYSCSEVLCLLRCMKFLPKEFYRLCFLERQVKIMNMAADEEVHLFLLSLWSKLLPQQAMFAIPEQLRCKNQKLQQALEYAIDKCLPENRTEGLLKTLTAYFDIKPFGLFLYGMIERMPARQLTADFVNEIKLYFITIANEKEVYEMLQIIDRISACSSEGDWNVKELIQLAKLHFKRFNSGKICTLLLLLLHRAAPEKRLLLLDRMVRMPPVESQNILCNECFTDLFLSFYLPDDFCPLNYLSRLATLWPTNEITAYMRHPRWQKEGFVKEWVKQNSEAIVDDPQLFAIFQQVYPPLANKDLYPNFLPPHAYYNKRKKILYVTCTTNAPLQHPDALFDLLAKELAISRRLPHLNIEITYSDGKGIDRGGVGRQFFSQWIQGLLHKSRYFRFAETGEGGVMPIPLKGSHFSQQERQRYCILGTLIGIAAAQGYPIGNVFHEGLFHVLFCFKEKDLMFHFNAASFLRNFSHASLVRLMAALLYAKEIPLDFASTSGGDMYSLGEISSLLLSEDALFVRQEAKNFLALLGENGDTLRKNCGMLNALEDIWNLAPLEEIRSLLRNSWLERFYPYFTAVREMAIGLHKIAPIDLGDIYIHSWEDFSFLTIKQIAQIFQGALSKDTFKKNIQVFHIYDSDFPVSRLRQQLDHFKAKRVYRWICQWIDSQELKALSQAIQTLTGAPTLTRKSPIQLKLSPHFEQVFIHTCFHTIDLPMDIAQSSFWAFLDLCATGSGENLKFDCA